MWNFITDRAKFRQQVFGAKAQKTLGLSVYRPTRPGRSGGSTPTASGARRATTALRRNDGSAICRLIAQPWRKAHNKIRPRAR